MENHIQKIEPRERLTFRDITRDNLLNLIINKIKSLREEGIPGLIECIGEPGAGKTTLKHQLLAKLTILKNVKILEFNCAPEFNIIDEITHYLDQSQISQTIPPELKQKIDKDDYTETTLKELLICLYDLKKDALILLLDDVHLLPQGELKKLSLVFSPEFTNLSQFLILFGRDGIESENKITIPPFSYAETTKWFKINFGTDWTNRQDKEIKWLHEKVNGNPLILNSAVLMLMEKGILSKYHLTPLSQFLPFKNSIKSNSRIKTLYSFSNLSKQEMNLLKLLSLLPDKIKTKEVKKIIRPKLKSIQTVFQISLKNRILVLHENHLEFHHPSIKEEIFITISEVEKQKLIKKIIQLKLNLKITELAPLILELKSIPGNKVNLLETYAEFLGHNRSWHYAISVYEKLITHRGKIKYTIKISKFWSKLMEYDKAEKSLKPILHKKGNPIYPDILLLWCEIMLYQIKLEEAKENLLKCLKLARSKQDANYLCTVYRWLITVYVRQYDKENSIHYLKKLEMLSDKSNLHLLTYYSSLAYVDSLIPGTCEKVKICKLGMNTADKLNKPRTALSFCHDLQFHYRKIHDQKKSKKYYEIGLKRAKHLFDIQLLVSINRIESYNLAFQDLLLQSQKKLTDCIELNLKFGNSQNVQIDLKTSFYNLFLIGRLDLSGKQKKIIETEVDAFPVHQKLPALNLLFKSYYLFGDTKKAKFYLKKVEKTADEIKRELHQMVALGYTIAFSKTKKISENDAEFSKVVKYLRSNQMNAELERLLLCRFMKYSEQKNILKMKEKFNEYLKLFPVDHDIIWKNYMRCLLEGIQGNNRNLTAILYEIEHSYNGTHIWFYHRLYKSLSRIDSETSIQQERFSQLTKLTKAIAFNSFDPKIVVPKGTNGFMRLLNQWHLAIKTKIISPNEINRFTSDENQKSSINESLAFWDINVQFPADNTGTTVKIIANLFGKPEIFIGNKQITRKGKLSGKSLEIFTYLLLKSYHHKNPVIVDELLMNIWPEIDDGEKQFKRLKTQMYYLRNHFGDKRAGLISWTGNQVTLDWDNFDFILDIEKFDSLINEMDQYETDDMEMLEIAAYHYTGPLLKGIDKLWVEPLRSFYLEKKMGIFQKLNSMYSKTNRDKDAFELIGRMSALHPEIQEIVSMKNYFFNNK